MPRNELLQYWREHYVLTQEDLAERVGANLKTEQRWEYEGQNPYPYYLTKLKELLGKSPRELGFVKKNEWPPIPYLKLDYFRNEFFTGREDILQQMHNQLAQLRPMNTLYITALVGMGGVGKTHIAVEYAYRYMHEYQTVVFLNASSREVLASEYAELAYSLFKLLKEKVQRDQKEAVNVVKEWLGNFSRYLLIFDRIDDLSLLTEFLPNEIKGDVIVTTQAQPTGTYAVPINVEPMPWPEGVYFLLRRSKGIDKDSPLQDIPANFITLAQEIAMLLDGLPLALDQAGAYIEETGYKNSLAEGLTQYAARFRRQRKMLLARRGFPSPDHPYPVTTTVTLALNEIKHINPLAVDLLKFFAFLSPDSIPEELILKNASQLGPLFRSFVSDPFALKDAVDDARDALLRFSLVQHRTSEGDISIHGLVQAVVQDKMTKKEWQVWAKRDIAAINHVFPYNGALDWWSLSKRYISQLLAVVPLIEEWKRWNIRSPEGAQLLTKAGEYLFFTSPRASPNFLNSGHILEIALKIQEDMLGPDHPDIAYTCLGLTYFYGEALGRSPLVYDNLERALAIREKALGPDHPDTASVLNLLARHQMDDGELAEAEKNFERALAIREKALGPDHPLTSYTLNDMGRFYEEHRKDYQRAETLYRRSLEIDLKTHGQDNPITAIVLNNLGLVLKKQGKYEEAEPFYQQAMHIREQWYDADHPLMAQSLHNLAKLYVAQQKYEQARPLLLRAYQVYKRNYPSEWRTIDLLLDLLELDLPKDEFEEIVDTLKDVHFQWGLHRLSDNIIPEILDDLERTYLPILSRHVE